MEIVKIESVQEDRIVNRIAERVGVEQLRSRILAIANNCDWFDSPCARQIRAALKEREEQGDERA